MAADRARLTIDLDRALHERLKVVSARKRTSMREYCVQAVERRLAGEPAGHLTSAAAPGGGGEPLFAGDHLIAAWQQCGLAKPSMATGIIRTVKASMIGRTLGVIPEQDLRADRA